MKVSQRDGTYPEASLSSSIHSRSVVVVMKVGSSVMRRHSSLIVFSSYRVLPCSRTVS